MKESYESYQAFLIDLIKETNKVISLIPNNNELSQSPYDIVYTLNKLKTMYMEHKLLKKDNEMLQDEQYKLQFKLKSCEENLKYWIDKYHKLSEKSETKEGE